MALTLTQDDIDAIAAAVATAILSTPANKLATDASGRVTLALSQGAITWGQQTISADVALEGALRIVNLNAQGSGVELQGDAGLTVTGTSVGAYVHGDTGGIIIDTYGTALSLSGPTAITPAWSTLTPQDVRDAMKMTPAAGIPNTGSIDAHLDDILSKVTNLPSDPADESALEAVIAALPTDADVQAAAAAALAAYDPPTKTEMDTAVSGITGLTAQEIRDALKLAPSTGAAATGSVDKHLDDIQAKTDTISVGSVSVTSPVATNGDVSIDAGYDYYSADGRALTWTDDTPVTWPNLTGATVTFRVGGLAVTGTVTNPTGPATITVELSKAQTSALGVGLHRFKIDAVLSNTHTVLQIKGKLLVS